MSDLPNTGWRVLPQAYLDKRPTPFSGSKIPASRYVAMRDGVRLAVDVYLPQSGGTVPAGKRFPTIVIFTPYYRRFKLRDGAPDNAETSPNAGRYRDFFVPRGYAVVVVDVRGTGASFGTREAFRSPEERDDYKEIVDWIVAQAWSDGRVGATGVSYVGAACDFVASTGHPAIKAIAPLFSVWDTYGDHYYPGGLLLNQLAKTYDELLVALDHDRRDLLTNFAYYKDPSLAGPMPVDDDRDGALVRAAVKEHLGNFHMTDFIREFPFKDDALPYDKSFTSASFSPYKYAAGIREDVAIYSVSGWMDGVGYTNGAIARFLTLPNPKKHLLIGPWDHGARMNVSVFRQQPESQFPMLPELLRFFDHYLMEIDSGLDQESPVHYFTMAEERWQDAAQWPPRPEEKRLFLAPNGQLGDGAGSDGADSFSRFLARDGREDAVWTARGAGRARLLHRLAWPRRDDAHVYERAGRGGYGADRASGHHAASLGRPGRCRGACLSRGRGAGRDVPLCDRGDAARAASPRVDGTALPSGRGTLSQLRAARRAAARARRTGDPTLLAAADLVARQGGASPAHRHRRPRQG